MGLNQPDGWQESGALQTIPIEVCGRDVGCCNQRHTTLKERVDEPAEYHGIANVTDKKLIETQGNRLFGNLLSDLFQRVFFSTMRRQSVVHTLHEPVKVHSEFAAKR